MNCEQQAVIEFLKEEVRVLREQSGGRVPTTGRNYKKGRKIPVTYWILNGLAVVLEAA